MKLKPYPEYKDSGVPWLGKVPKDWEVYPNRALFYERKCKNNLHKEMLSVVINKGVIPQKELLSNTSKKDSSNEDKSNYKLVLKGDLAYNKMHMWQGAVGASQFEGIVSPAYIVIHPREGLSEWYCHYLFRSPAYIKESHRFSYGICDDQLSLRYEDFKTISTPKPTFYEQERIVKYIKFKSSQIVRFIRARKRMIELLKEQKQAIINDAVTGKIDVRTGKPHPKYKPSGVEWLGDVPEGWKVYPLKRCVKSNIDSLSEKTDPKYEFEYIEINKVKSGYMISAPVKLNFGNSPSRARRKVKRGVTIISTVRTYLRSVLFIDFENCDNLIVSTGFSVLSPNTEINPRFLGYLLRSDNFIDRVIQNSIGVS